MKQTLSAVDQSDPTFVQTPPSNPNPKSNPNPDPNPNPNPNPNRDQVNVPIYAAA